MAIKDYVQRMSNAFGMDFLVLLFLIQCLLKGLTFAIMTTGMLPLFKSMGVDAVQLQIFGAIAMSPWTLKPAIGLLSDLVALGGYHKRYYLLFALVIGLFGVASMLINITIPVFMVILLFCVHLSISVGDLLMEATYARKMNEPKGIGTGSSIITLVSGFQQVGFLIALSFMGVVADHNLFYIGYIVCLCCIASPIIPLIKGWLPEKRRHLWESGVQRACNNKKWVLLDTVKLHKEWRVFALVACTGLAGPIMSGITAWVNEIVGLVCSFTILIIIIVFSYRVLPRDIANVTLYQVLTQVSRVSVGSALDYFFTASPTCLPNGPNFTYTFYTTWTGLIGSVVSIVGMFVYQLFFNRWKYRGVLLLTTCLSAAGGLFDFIMTMRWNITYLHIPDQYFYILGDGIIHDFVDTLNWIPSSSIIAKVCPEGMQASIFSFIAGISNYGRMLSVLTGAQMIRWSGVKTVEPCYWTPLPWLILGGHILCMLLVSVPSILLLIPDNYQDESLDEKEEEEQLEPINDFSL